METKRKAFLTYIKGHNSVVQNEISPLAIPYYSSPIPMSMQSLKKIGQKVLMLEHGNEALMDGQTDERTGQTLKVRRV